MITQLVHDYFDAFNRHDLETMLSLMTEDVRHDLNQGETQIGVDKFREFKLYMDSCYREQITDLVVMTAENVACAEFTCSGTYLKRDGNFPEAHGQTYAIRAAAIFEDRQGKIARITSYYNVPDWVAQII
jgi:steroid delta-isomerase-like uncharacterized protein